MSDKDQLYQRIAPDVKLGKGVKIFAFTNLYGCEVGDGSKVGAFVEIQKGVKIGQRCKISSHSFLCEGVTIEDEVFIGHNVTFINDRFPRATNKDGSAQTEADWSCVATVVKRRASIGSGATILVRRCDRRGSNGRCRQRRYEVRSGRRRGGGQSCPPASDLRPSRNRTDGPACKFPS